MTAKSPERELSLIHKALGEGLDAKLWPKRLSAPAAVQRLVNLVTESDHVGTIARLEERIRELELEREALHHSAAQQVEQSKQVRQDLETTRQKLDESVKVESAYRKSLDEALRDRNTYEQQWQEEIERSTRLEQALAEARAESVLAIADRMREVAVGFRERVKSRLGRA